MTNMTQETILWCLSVLNDACPFDEYIDYDKDTNEFVFKYFIDIADPDGMGGISTKIHEYKRLSEDDTEELAYKIMASIDAIEACVLSCIRQSEIPQEAWFIAGIDFEEMFN